MNRKLKFILPGILAILVTLAISAFKTEKKEQAVKPADTFYFELDPTLSGFNPYSYSYRLDQDNYRLVNGSGNIPQNCPEQDIDPILCQIQAEGVGTPLKPDINGDPSLKSALDNSHGSVPTEVAGLVWLTENVTE